MPEVSIVPTHESKVYGIVLRASKEMIVAATKHESIMNCILEDVRRVVTEKSKELFVE